MPDTIRPIWQVTCLKHEAPVMSAGILGRGNPHCRKCAAKEGYENTDVDYQRLMCTPGANGRGWRCWRPIPEDTRPEFAYDMDGCEHPESNDGTHCDRCGCNIAGAALFADRQRKDRIAAYHGQLNAHDPAPEPTAPIDATLAERGARYGDFTDHARITEALLGVMMGDSTAGRFATSWGTMKPFQRQAIRVICDKLARIANGDPDYVDNWHDLQGYSKLVEDRLTK